MVEYSFKRGNGLKTSKKLDITLSSKLSKPKKVPVKKNTKMVNIFTNEKYSQSLEYGIMMCFDTGIVD